MIHINKLMHSNSCWLSFNYQRQVVTYRAEKKGHVEVLK